MLHTLFTSQQKSHLQFWSLKIFKIKKNRTIVKHVQSTNIWLQRSNVVQLPFRYASWIWFVANLWWLFCKVVLFNVNVKRNVLILEVSKHLLSCFLQTTQLLKWVADLRLQLSLNCFNHLLFLLTEPCNCYQIDCSWLIYINWCLTDVINYGC